MFDIITIGSATQDIFVEADCAKILNLREITSKQNWLCFDYGAKLDIDQVAFDIGGGAVNTAVNFAKLGFNTATIIKLGEDLNAKAINNRLEEVGISRDLIIHSKELKTGFSVILTSFEGDRTVLAHRGANGHLTPEDINWEMIKQSKWVYIAPLSKESNKILDALAEFAEENGVNMAFNPGTTTINRGIENLKKILSTAEVVMMNKDEASQLLGTEEKPRSKHDKPETTKISSYIQDLLMRLKSYNPKIVVITDGKNGVYAYDGKYFYQEDSFPAPVVSTLGAGDAFSSTFVATLIKFDWDVEKALAYGAINSSSVIQYFGAQTGLKNFEDIEKLWKQHPDYKVRKYTLEELET